MIPRTEMETREEIERLSELHRNLRNKAFDTLHLVRLLIVSLDEYPYKDEERELVVQDINDMICRADSLYDQAKSCSDEMELLEESLSQRV